MSLRESGSEQKGDSWFGIIVSFVVIFTFFTLIPSLIAIPLYLLLRNKLRKRESLILLASFVIAFLSLSIKDFDYFVRWQVNFVFDQGINKADVPWLVIVNIAFILLFTSLAFLSNKIDTKIPTFKKTPEPSTGLMPSYEEKEIAKKIVTVPNSAMTITKSDHTTENDLTFPKRKFPIGVDKNRQPVFIQESELRYHGIIFGSTGSGKTELIKTIAGGLLDLGWFGMILDLKEDTSTGGLRDWCEDYSEHNILPFQDFALSNPEPKFWFSPLHGIGPDEALNTILASQKFEDAYYRSLNEKQLGQLITLMHYSHKIDPHRFPELTVLEIGNILSSLDLREACKEMAALVISTYPEFSKKDFDSLLIPNKQGQEVAVGLGARLTGIYNTEAGRRALRAGDGREELDVTLSGLTYVGLDSMGKGELTRLISASILRRMAVYAADRTTGKAKGGAGKIQPRFLIVDEANFVDKKILLELLSRARSSFISVIVCTQGPSDWNAKTIDEPGLTSLLQNCNVSLIMSQGEQSNAEICANIIGRENRQDVTQRINQLGEIMEAGSIRNITDFIVSADEIRGLGIGEVIVRISRPEVRSFWAQSAMRDPKNKIK